MPDYPGVDPDGLIPGGLQIAGKVNAGALAVLGQAIVPNVIDWGTWSGDTGINVPHGTFVNLPLDSEDKALKYITFANPDTKLTFNTAGMYLAMAIIFANTNTGATGFVQGRFVLSAGTSWFRPSGLDVPGLVIDNLFILGLCDVAAGATIAVRCSNSQNADDTFATELAIARLA